MCYTTLSSQWGIFYAKFSRAIRSRSQRRQRAGICSVDFAVGHSFHSLLCGHEYTNAAARYRRNKNNGYPYTCGPGVGSTILTWDGANPISCATGVTIENGNVGIGTADPSLAGGVTSKFTVVTPDGSTGLAIGNTAGVPRFAVNGNPDGSFTVYDYAAGSWTAGITQQNGYVGIGTEAPPPKSSACKAPFVLQASPP